MSESRFYLHLTGNRYTATPVYLALSRPSPFAAFLYEKVLDQVNDIDRLINSFGLPPRFIEQALGELIRFNLAILDLEGFTVQKVQRTASERFRVTRQPGSTIQVWQDDHTGWLLPWQMVRKYQAMSPMTAEMITLSDLSQDTFDLQKDYFPEIPHARLIQHLNRMPLAFGLERNPEFILDRVIDRLPPQEGRWRVNLYLPLGNAYLKDEQDYDHLLRFVELPELPPSWVQTLNRSLNDKSVQMHPLKVALLEVDRARRWYPQPNPAVDREEVIRELETRCRLENPIQEQLNAWQQHCHSWLKNLANGTSGPEDLEAISETYRAVVETSDELIRLDLTLPNRNVFQKNSLGEWLRKPGSYFSVLALTEVDDFLLEQLAFWRNNRGDSETAPTVLLFYEPLEPHDQRLTALLAGTSGIQAMCLPTHSLSGNWLSRDGRYVLYGPRGPLGKGWPMLGLHGSAAGELMLDRVAEAVDVGTGEEMLEEWRFRHLQVDQPYATRISHQLFDPPPERGLTDRIHKLWHRCEAFAQDWSTTLLSLSMSDEPGRPAILQKGNEDDPSLGTDHRQKLDEMTTELDRSFNEIDLELERVALVVLRRVNGDEHWRWLACLALQALSKRLGIDVRVGLRPVLNLFTGPPDSTAPGWPMLQWLVATLANAGVDLYLAMEIGSDQERELVLAQQLGIGVEPDKMRHFKYGQQPNGSRFRGISLNHRIHIIGTFCPFSDTASVGKAFSLLCHLKLNSAHRKPNFYDSFLTSMLKDVRSYIKVID